MKKLWKRLRNWLIGKLGGVTREAHESLIRAEKSFIQKKHREYLQTNAMARDQIILLAAENYKLQQEIDKLNFALAEKQPLDEFKIGTMEIKPFRLVCSHKRDELFAEAEIEAAKFRMRREMASSIGRQLLEKGAIRVSERENPVNNSIDVLMEVRVVC